MQTGATGYGSFNQRFAQPNELGSFNQTKFPFLYKVTTDPLTGRKDGMGVRIPAGLEPKLMLVDSGSEYWDRGRVAALRHTSPDGREDVEDAPNVRVYLLAGTRHGAGSFPPADNPVGVFKENTNDYRWAQRGLLAALDAWVRKGTPPPPSRHPRLADGTLVARDNLEFPAIPGVKWPARVPGGYRSDVSGPDAALAFMVSKVDADGNDVGGIRLPEQAVPLATLTGWQFRSERIGSPDTLLAMAGAYIPFPTTRAEREKNEGPAAVHRGALRHARRLSRQGAGVGRTRWRGSVTSCRTTSTAIVQAAGRHWDALMAPGGRRLRRPGEDRHLRSGRVAWAALLALLCAAAARPETVLIADKDGDALLVFDTADRPRRAVDRPSAATPTRWWPPRTAAWPSPPTPAATPSPRWISARARRSSGSPRRCSSIRTGWRSIPTARPST